MADPLQHTPSQTDKGTSSSFASSSSQLLILATLVPFGATLLVIAGLILTVTVIGLTLATPLFVIFSPVLLPAALLFALAVAGFFASGAFGITSLSSFAWLASYLRRSRLRSPPGVIVDDIHMAQKTEEASDSLPWKAQEEDKETQKETERKEANKEAQKETARKAQKDAGETEKARKENRTSS